MFQSIFLNVLSILLIDLAIVLGLIIVIYFITVLINLIRNGKSHKITNNNIMGYSLSLCGNCIRKNCSQIVKWLVIIFAIHLIAAFFDSAVNWAKGSVTYEKVPIFALAIDIIKPIFNAIFPVILPIVAILLGIIAIYAVAKAIENMPSNSKKWSINNKQTVQNSQVVTVKRVVNNPALRKGFFSYFFQFFQAGLIYVAKFLPKLFIIIAICVGLNSVFLSINNITKIVDDYKAIQELNVTVKNLSNSEAFVRVWLIDERAPVTAGKAPMKTYKIQVLSASGDVVSEQIMQLEGQQIVVDSININFDYSKISNGEKYNIAYPYRIYTEVIPSSKARPLNCMFNDKEIPVIYCLENDNIYGLEKDVFYKRLEEIFSIIKNDTLSKEAGIRSSIGNAIHLTMKKDDIIDISIEGTGGLSVSKHKTLYGPNED